MNTVDHVATRPPPQARAALVRIAGLVLLLLAGMAIAFRLGLFDYRHSIAHISRLQQHHSPLGFMAGFVFAFAVGTALGAPGLPLTVVGGVLFGAMLGTALSWAGGLLGAAAGYWIARTIGHDIVLRWLKRFRRLDATLKGSRDFAGILRLRLIPVLPIGVVNFSAGLAKAPFGAYMAASAIGALPATMIYAYFADGIVEGITTRGEALTSLIVASVLMLGLSLVPRLLRARS